MISTDGFVYAILWKLNSDEETRYVEFFRTEEEARYYYEESKQGAYKNSLLVRAQIGAFELVAG